MTEGMELGEDKIREYFKRITINHYYFIYPAGNWETKDDTEKIQWEMETEYWVKPILLEIRDNIARAQIAKVLSNLPTEQEIREKTQDKIARDLYKIIADNNYDMASVIRYLDKIVKLKAGQSPKEV